MKLRLIHKLLIALFASTAGVLMAMLWLAQVNIGRGFEDFLMQQERTSLPPISAALSDWYRQSGSWEDMRSNPRQFQRILQPVLSAGEPQPARPGGRAPRPADGPPGRPGQRPPGRGDNNALHRRIFLLDNQMTAVIGRYPNGIEQSDLTSVEVDSDTVGWLGIAPLRGLQAPEEHAFSDLMKRSLLTGGALGLVIAALLAWLLARHISKPLVAAAAGVRKLAAGNYHEQVKISGDDETARLGQDINRLAMALSDHEVARQRWIADIAHELRTPLAIMRGEIEAMSDGVREMSSGNLASVQQEVGHLSALVDDLQNLAMSDTGALSFKMRRFEFTALVSAVADAARSRAVAKGLELKLDEDPEPAWIEGDEQRLRQLLHNLLENAVRYTDTPGQIEISFKQVGKDFTLTISDSAPGVSDTELDQLFDRFYRVEASRNRKTGGSGLGLAICRNIVEAHGGSIVAEAGSLGGISMTVRLKLV